MNKAIVGLSILFITLGVCLLAIMFLIEYDEFIIIALNVLGRHPEEKTKLTSLISKNAYFVIQTSPILFCFFGSLTFFYSNKILLFFKQLTSFFRFINFFKNLPKKYAFSVAIVVLGFSIFSIYNILYMPISYDEAWTYLHFTTQGFFYSVSHYPLPNNHVLHSVLTNITYNFPFSQTTNLRLPNLVISIFGALCFFYTFSKILNEKIALTLLPLYCFLFPTLYYAYHSRGYALVMLSFLIIFYSTLRLTNFKKDDVKNFKYYVYLSLGAIMGFYTMPSFLYPYLTCVSYIFLFNLTGKNYKSIKAIILSCFATSIVVIILYLPIFIATGIESVYDNDFVRPIPFSNVVNQLSWHFNETSKFLIGIPLICGVLLFLVSGVILLYKKEKSVLFIVYCFIITPNTIMLASSCS